MTTIRETFIKSDLIVEATTTTGSSPTITPSHIALNTTNKDESTTPATAATGLKLTPSRTTDNNNVSTSTLAVESQTSGDLVKVTVGSTQHVVSNLAKRSSETAAPDGIKFSNDAEFTIVDDSSTTVTVRISDIWNALKSISQYDNVISALCRANRYQTSSDMKTYDEDWIERYATINTTQTQPPNITATDPPTHG